MIKPLFSLTLAVTLGLSSVAAQPQEVDLTPENIILTTRDGLELKGRYFPGRHERETIPVIILHGWDERGSTYEALAKQLQSEEYGGHAVFVPDLRGHGGSNRLADPKRNRVKELSADKLSKADLLAMIEYDLDTVKNFLMEKHNEGELNIDMLSVIGSEEGGVLAAHWAAHDWSWPPLAGTRQGQDVKGLVLLSPPQNVKGLSAREAVPLPGMKQDISVMVIVGRTGRRAASHAKRLHGALQVHRPQQWASQQERQENQDLFLYEVDTSLQGSKLLGEKSLGVTNKIHQFLDWRLRRRAHQHPWEERNLPLGS
ncbi:MAG: alpha/beta fold hydrolase [Planctomycetota bacterium]